MASEHTPKWDVHTPGIAVGNSSWHAESEPHVTPIRNEADSIPTQVVIPFLWHWEAALMLCPAREGSRGAG